MARRAQPHRPVGVAHGEHARGLGHAVDLEHRHVELLRVRPAHGYRDRRAAAGGEANAGDVRAGDRYAQRGRQHRGHAAEHARLVALDQPPDVADGVRFAPARRRDDHQRAAARERAQGLRERTAHVEQRQPEQQGAAGSRGQHQAHGPGLVHLIAMGMAHELGHAGSAAGVEVAGRVVRGNAPATGQAVARVFVDQRIEAVYRVGLVGGAVHHHDGLEVRQIILDALHLVPDVGAGQGAERDQHFGVGRTQNLGDLLA